MIDGTRQGACQTEQEQATADDYPLPDKVAALPKSLWQLARYLFKNLINHTNKYGRENRHNNHE